MTASATHGIRRCTAYGAASRTPSSHAPASTGRCPATGTWPYPATSSEEEHEGDDRVVDARVEPRHPPAGRQLHT